VRCCLVYQGSEINGAFEKGKTKKHKNKNEPKKTQNKKVISLL